MKEKMKIRQKTILVTGGAGFIGSALIRRLVKKNYYIINIDKLSYASDLRNLHSIKKYKNYKFIKANISNLNKLKNIFKKYTPQYVINCAAESHVDRSIKSSGSFIKSNIIGTYNLLECVRISMIRNKFYQKNKFHLFHQVSTDEVFGDSEKLKTAPDENSNYNPSSPYSATKASSDNLVVAWGRTFNIPYTISICTNNYGPFQFPEKLIPVIILNSLKGKKIPVYGDGKQIRDWLYVEDHVDAILKIVFNKKIKNEKFNISGNNQVKNIDLVKIICNLLNRSVKLKPKNVSDFKKLIEFTKDRLGHDRRYFLKSRKITDSFGWTPKYPIKKALKITLNWYLKNREWCKNKV